MHTYMHVYINIGFSFKVIMEMSSIREISDLHLRKRNVFTPFTAMEGINKHYCLLQIKSQACVFICANTEHAVC